MSIKRAWLRLRTMWRGVTRRRQLDEAMDEEMRFHIEMEAARLVRECRLSAQEARRQAHVAFGGVEKYKAEGRDTRGVRWIDAISLDMRLGIRMLMKHRGLTLVGGFAMAVAIAIGATFFEAFAQMASRDLPFEGGDRVVALAYATQTPGSAERRVLRDFSEWRDQIQSVEQLGAFRTAQHNLVAGEPPYEAISVAEVTAAAFAIARTPPLFGRYLLPADERHGAPAVIVIAHQVWQSRFAGDVAIVGREINVGGIPTTIVGVMPEGFAFPFDHRYWMPLREDPLQYERLQGPEVYVFGRLAEGATLEAAQSELSTIAGRTFAADQRYAQLRAVVMPYTFEHVGLTDPLRMWILRVAQVLVTALTVVVAVNLAILVYARTVTRLGEIAVRTALGASRRRILSQLFIESLALSFVGAVVGLLLAQIALAQLQRAVAPYGIVPYWIKLELSAATVAYAFGLAALAAVVMGVLPGLKATGQRVAGNVRELDGRSGNRLGPTWTTLVVTQVAVAVAVLPLAVYLTWQVAQMEFARPGFAAEQFVVGALSVDSEGSGSDVNRLRTAHVEMTARLESEPGVSAVTFSSGVPGFASGRLLRFADGQTVKYSGLDLGVDSLDVGLNLFTVYDAEIIAGRPLVAADLGSADAVVVNEAFVREFLGTPPGRALGIQFRYVAPYERPGTDAAAIYEVVGVVRDFPAFPPEPGSEGQPTVYHGAIPGGTNPVMLSIRFARDVPPGFVDRFRSMGATVDSGLQMPRVVPLVDYYAQVRSVWRYLAWGVSLLTFSVLMLSAAGIYAMMSFTVTQRTREIAVRAALGAAPHQLMLNVFGRASWQLALGLLAGTVLSAGVFQNTDFTVVQAATFTLTVAAMMTLVSLLAAFGPVRRGLRVDAREALQADA